MSESFANFIPEDSEVFTVGVCSYEVLDLKHGVSQAQNPKIDFTLELTDVYGVKRQSKGNGLVMSDKTKWKVKEFAVASGLENSYKEGKLTDNVLLNAKGKAIVVEEGYIDKDGKPRKALKIDSWLPPGDIETLRHKEPSSKEKIESGMDDDDIKF